ncbi:MAG: GxxExxY protein [Vicinamibacterales bacterium]
MLKVTSPLTPKQEEIVDAAMESAFSVHRALGPGFKEIIYKRAYLLELESRKLKFESEKKILARYKEWQIPGQTIDLIVEEIVLVELKAVPKLRPIHRRQVISYLQTMDLRVGLLINFNVQLLKHGFQRLVN